MLDSTLNPLSFPNADDPQPDQRPLPEIVAAGKPDEPENPGWETFPLAYHDVEGKRYYSIQDWILGVAKPANTRVFWGKMKPRLKKANVQLLTWCQQLPYTANNGKTYDMDFATAEGLYIITQRMDAETGLRDRILRFLAKAGVVVDEARVDPDGLLAQVVGKNPDRVIEAVIEFYRKRGDADEWIASRILSVQTRKWFVSEFQRSLLFPPASPLFGKITNTMRRGVWKRDTGTLKKEMNLKENDSLRDHMPGLALTYEMIAENASAYVLSFKHGLTFNEADQIVREKSELVGKQAAEMGRTLNIDIATGKPLLHNLDAASTYDTDRDTSESSENEN